MAMQALKNQLGENLDYSLHSPKKGSSQDLILIGHGVTANKDREFLVTLAETLADNGYEALRFSFSGNGDSEGDFRQSCPSKEVDDLKAIIDAFPDRALSYVGHSMGGAVGVLAISKQFPILKFISLAGMVHTALFAKTEFGDVTPDSENGTMWEKPECPLSQTFVDDMNAIDSVLPLAPSISIPWLIVHGSEDDVVPIEHSRELTNSNKSIELIEIDKADHVFSNPDHANTMAANVTQWLKKNP